MKINLIRYSNSMDKNASYLSDSEQFINEVNNELFDEDIALVENDEDFAFSVVFIETGGSEQKFIKDVEKLQRPIILLSNCKNNSLPACFEIKTYLENRKDNVILVFGDEKVVARSLSAIAKVMTARNDMNNMNLGVIGKPSDWLIASQVDYKKAHDLFGVNLIDITTEELKEEINKGDLDYIPHYQEFLNLIDDKERLDVAIHIYSGLKRIIAKYNLKGFTLRCFDLIGEYQNTACLAFAMLNEEGILASCEGDVPSLLTMLVIKEVTSQPSFMANPSKIDINNGELLLAHCTLPLNMCNKYELMTHFESGLGIGVRGILDTKEITIFKIAPDLKECVCVKGEIKDNLNLPNYCRTQILVKLEIEELFEFLKENFGNHVLVCYGNVGDKLLTMFHFLLDLNHE